MGLIGKTCTGGNLGRSRGRLKQAEPVHILDPREKLQRLAVLLNVTEN